MEIEKKYGKTSADILAAVKQGNYPLDFSGWVFRGSVIINFITFKGGVNFEGAIFKSVAIFQGVTFKEFALFNDSQFKQEAIFLGARFESISDFDNTRFSGNVAFSRAVFMQYVDFKESFAKKVENLFLSILPKNDGDLFDDKTELKALFSSFSSKYH
jgi:hypothetical protein